VVGNLNPTSGHLSFFFSGYNAPATSCSPAKPRFASSCVPRALQQATHVYVRHDAVKSLLQRPYDGPFLVIQRNDKFSTLNKNGCRDAVSIDRLKPAFLEKMDDPPLKPTTHPMTPVPPDTIEPPLPTVLPTPSLTTRSGRTVHLPRRYRTGGGVFVDSKQSVLIK
jgi:hypothetical protein